MKEKHENIEIQLIQMNNESQSKQKMELSWTNINATISEPKKPFYCLNKLLNKNEPKEVHNFKKIVISDGMLLFLSIEYNQIQLK
jgi:hypothetical protein